MADIKVNRDSKFVKVLASQVKNKPVALNDAKEAAEICDELMKNPTPENRHQVAQTIGFVVNELQSKELDFLSQFADMKTVGYNDKAAFRVKLGGPKAYIQSKGSTTARSYVADKQITVDTVEISVRPAINIVDSRAGRVDVAELIRDANREITYKKLGLIESVMHDAIDNFSTPFYATGTGIVKATLDAQIAYFSRLGPVTLIGDRAAVAQLAPLAGMAMNSTTNQFDSRIIDEYNDNGFIGKYNGCNVVALQNGYRDDATTPILNPNWIYIVPGGMSGDAKNLKYVEEGGINAFESQNIDD